MGLPLEEAVSEKDGRRRRRGVTGRPAIGHGWHPGHGDVGMSGGGRVGRREKGFYFYF
jgi:hypothetical protein